MSEICAEISKDILKNCDDTPVMGIEQRLVLINESDLPASGIIFDTVYKNSLITDINLITGKTGYEVQNIKQIMNYTNSLESSEDSENGVLHQINGIRIYDPSEEARKEINSFIGGAKVYAVLERKWKGIDNKYAFLFFGLKFGLELKELVDNSNENDGTMVLSLGTPSGFKEPYVPHIYRDTNYETSLVTFNNKFGTGGSEEGEA